MRIPEAYDAGCWEAHWAAGLRGEAGHWPEPGISFLPSCVSDSRSMSLRAEWERKREGV